MILSVLENKTRLFQVFLTCLDREGSKEGKCHRKDVVAA